LFVLVTSSQEPTRDVKYTLAIDQSTSATKAMLFGETLGLAAHTAVEHRQIYPRPGWVEHDPEEILRNTYTAVKQLLATSNVKPSDIESVAITNQRETVVVWDRRTGKPIYNAVVWQCNRGTRICEDLVSQGYEHAVRAKTGLIINPYFSASGVRWILENVQGAAQSARDGHLLMGTIDSWLIWNLTSGRVHATDYTNASRTLLFNISTLNWDTELLAMFHVPISMMPDILTSDGNYGATTMNGMLHEIPITGVLGDSHGALAGQMCFRRGMGKATYGTGSSIMVNIGETPLTAPNGMVTSIGFAAKGKIFYVCEGNIHCTGATIKWMQDELGLIQSADMTETLARSVEDTDGVYFVPAFTGLGAPWWDEHARAMICGMSRGTTRAHVVRAALESIAYQVKDLVMLIQESGVNLDELRVDGGPTKNSFLMQFQADVLQAPVNRSTIQEASALGAAVMSAFALDRLSDFTAAAALRTSEDYIAPTMPAARADELYMGWKKAVQRTILRL
jgi:glycerol kinase